MVASELSFTECGPQRISCIWQFKHWFWHAPLRKILFLLWIPSLITLYQFRHTLIKFHRCANCPLPSVVTYSTLRDHLIASCKLEKWANITLFHNSSTQLSSRISLALSADFPPSTLTFQVHPLSRSAPNNTCSGWKFPTYFMKFL